jgi:hypothetical protein
MVPQADVREKDNKTSGIYLVILLVAAAPRAVVKETI